MSVPLETQIYQALIGDATLVGLVGNAIYLGQMPQNSPSYPALIYQRISTMPIYVNSPGSGLQASVGWSRFQFTFYVASKTAAADLEALCRALLNIFNNFNAWALPTSPLVNTQSPNFLLNRRMEVEPNTSPPLFKAILDFKIYYQNQ